MEILAQITPAVISSMPAVRSTENGSFQKIRPKIYGRDIPPVIRKRVYTARRPPLSIFSPASEYSSTLVAIAVAITSEKGVNSNLKPFIAQKTMAVNIPHSALNAKPAAADEPARR